MFLFPAETNLGLHREVATCPLRERPGRNFTAHSHAQQNGPNARLVFPEALRKWQFNRPGIPTVPNC